MSAQTREIAVQVATERERLRRVVSALEKRSAKIQNQTERARRRGDLDAARVFEREKEQCETDLVLARQELEQNTGAMEEVKAAMRAEEERIREETKRNLEHYAALKRSLMPHFLPAFTNNTGSNRMDFFAWAALTLLVLALFLFLWLRMAA